jgi:cell division protein FtsX
MGRAVYNYVVHLKNEITTRDNTIRTLRETAKQRDGFRGAELHTKQKRIEELEQSVRVLEQKLAQAVTVRRAQPTPRSLSLAEITKDQRIGG